MSLALALHGSPYYIGMAVLSALFFIALKQITTGLQKIFVRALVAREREAALAIQFDTGRSNFFRPFFSEDNTVCKLQFIIVNLVFQDAVIIATGGIQCFFICSKLKPVPAFTDNDLIQEFFFFCIQ